MSHPLAGPSDRVRRFLRALASESRQEVMMLFVEGDELAVGQVAAVLGIGQSTASEQLAQLRDGGVLKSRRQGKTVLYRADRNGVVATLGDLQDFLTARGPQPLSGTAGKVT